MRWTVFAASICFWFQSVSIYTSLDFLEGNIEIQSRPGWPLAFTDYPQKFPIFPGGRLADHFAQLLSEHKWSAPINLSTNTTSYHNDLKPLEATWSHFKWLQVAKITPPAHLHVLWSESVWIIAQVTAEELQPEKEVCFVCFVLEVICLPDIAIRCQETLRTLRHPYQGSLAFAWLTY